MGKKTKIDWADATWNPVTGCLHDCEYCYAKRIAERFEPYEIYDPEMALQRHAIANNQLIGLGAPYVLDFPWQQRNKNGTIQNAPYPFGFAPTFHRYRLDEPARWTRPRNIFVCSMADLFGDWVPDVWIKEVFAACEKAPQHRYLFLTKNPARYMKMYNARYIQQWNERHPEKPHRQTEEYKGVLTLPAHDNWWFGSTLDSMKSRRAMLGCSDHTFVSIEPLTERMEVGLGSFGDDEWIIIGAETGNRKGKVIPRREWVEEIVEAANITGASVFMKESLRELMGSDFRQEFPWSAYKGDKPR